MARLAVAASLVAFCLPLVGHARNPHQRPWGRTSAQPAYGAASLEPKVEAPRVPIGEPLWVGQPKLKKALDAMDGKGWSVALKALKAIELDAAAPALQGAVQYLIGRCLAKLGRTRVALDALEQAKALMPALDGYIAATEVELMWADERFSDADEALKLVPPAHPRFADLNLKAAKTMIKRRRFGVAVDLIDRVYPHIGREWFKARFALIEAEARLGLDGDVQAWQVRMAGILRRWSRYRAGADAEEALLEALSPKDRGPFTLTEWAGRAVHHIRKGEVLRARAIVKAVGRAWPEKSAGMGDLIAGWRLLKKSPFDTLRRANDAIEAARSSSIRRHLMHLKAEGLRRSEKAGAALKLYRRLAKDMPASPMKADLLWDGAELARRMRRPKVARSLYEALAELPPETPLLKEKLGRVLWEVAWAYYRTGDLDVADQWLVRLINTRPMETDSSRRTFYERATYWRARIHQKQGRLGEARALWQYINDRYPLSYYATMSRHWLGGTGAEPSPLKGVVPEAPYTPEALAEVLPGLGPEEQGAAILWRLGLKEDARLALKRLHRLGRITPEGLDFASALYRECDNLWIAHWLMKKSEPLMFAPTDDPRRRWQASFPTPYSEIVSAEAEARGVDPMLVWAIMRQESGFRAKIKSYANAHGLMQLLKGTAAMMATKFLDEKRAPSLKTIYTPEGNIKYGTAFLGRLLERYRGHPALAIAAYNAGPGRVNKWLKKVGHLDVDEFVEEIPYDQTRAYTRTVLRSYAAYRALYGPEGHKEIYIPLRVRQPQKADPPVAQNDDAATEGEAQR
ncbi:MAG: transglycosylase SLT domain-containing protein [Bradymonadia bacterium]